MNKVFTIDSTLINKAAYRPQKNATLLFLVIILCFQSVGNHIWQESQDRILIIFLSGITTALALGALLLFSFSLRKRIYSNIEIHITDKGIEKGINYDKLGKTNFFVRLMIDKANRASGLYKGSLQWNKIVSVIENKNDLALKFNDASTFTETGLISIPKEIEDYEELKRVIAYHLQNTVATI